MGTNYKCGCRTSRGAYYLCPLHEQLMEEALLVDELGEEALGIK